MLFVRLLLMTIAAYTMPATHGVPDVANAHPNQAPGTNPYASVGLIPVPPGFSRVPVPGNSFAGWLRSLPLKKSKTVYTYSGVQKPNQSAQFAVIDISTGDKDLQQCADAVIRLRAEFLFSQQQFAAIDFVDNNKTHYRLPPGAARPAFDRYLQTVFAYCGTASLEKQLLPVVDFNQVNAGDVLIRGGSPGHAMLVMDVAMDARGSKVYLLAQSYMPAQDMHVVLNPARPGSPWYAANDQTDIITPEWTFRKQQLRKWPSHSYSKD
ncbi:MAG: DUF4846 domain-containing protein [Chitinophagaceae bacterium]